TASSITRAGLRPRPSSPTGASSAPEPRTASPRPDCGTRPEPSAGNRRMASEMRRTRWLGLLSSLGLVLTSCAVAGTPRAAIDPAIHKIKHVIIIMQENRSFDSYFGTYPGADGIPMRHGRPTVCIPDPALGHCVRPFHDPSLVNEGGPHGVIDAVRDVDGGRMDGFVMSAIRGRHQYCARQPFSPDCTQDTGRRGQPDAVGWHDAREIPNYWAYAEHF